VGSKSGSRLSRIFLCNRNPWNGRCYIRARSSKAEKVVEVKETQESKKDVSIGGIFAKADEILS